MRNLSEVVFLGAVSGSIFLLWFGYWFEIRFRKVVLRRVDIVATRHDFSLSINM